MLGKREEERGSRLQQVFGKLAAAALPVQDLRAKEGGTAVQGPPSACDQFPPPDDRCLSAPALSRRVECELRAAKRARLLSCGEVLLPRGLLRRVARDVLAAAESEPCGLRGCLLHVDFETSDGRRRRLGSVRCDPGTAATHELGLTLKQSPAVAWSVLPVFLRNLARGGTIVVSPAYVLSKKKLYRSILE